MRTISRSTRAAVGLLAVLVLAAGSAPGETDYFTELFESGMGSLCGKTVVFTPVGGPDFYEACLAPLIGGGISGFPTDPSGGTVLPLGNYDSILVTLNDGASVSLYGTSYTEFYVGTNGYITFGAPDTEHVASLAAHFSLPRISALFTHLEPEGYATTVISWKQLDDRAVVTYEDIHTYFEPSSSYFQIEMFFDGKIAVTFLPFPFSDGTMHPTIVGLSAGLGLPPSFAESNMEGYEPCSTTDYFTETFEGEESLGDYFDLAGSRIVFWPSGELDHYRVCRESATGFPTNPTGGTTLALDDNDSVLVPLNGGISVSLYGVSYSEFYVGSNGAVAFEAGDPGPLGPTQRKALKKHFDQPRISGYASAYSFLGAPHGTVSWKQLGDRVAVTYQGVNSVQIEMFYSGKITITILNVYEPTMRCVVGLSAGEGLPPYFAESDLSEYGACYDLAGIIDTEGALLYSHYGRDWGEDDLNHNEMIDRYEAVLVGAAVRDVASPFHAEAAMAFQANLAAFATESIYGTGHYRVRNAMAALMTTSQTFVLRFGPALGLTATYTPVVVDGNEFFGHSGDLDGDRWRNDWEYRYVLETGGEPVDYAEYALAESIVPPGTFLCSDEAHFGASGLYSTFGLFWPFADVDANGEPDSVPVYALREILCDPGHPQHDAAVEAYLDNLSLAALAGELNFRWFYRMGYERSLTALLTSSESLSRMFRVAFGFTRTYTTIAP